MLTVETTTSLKLASPLPLTAHPASVYLRSLSPRSRITMQGSLNAIASLLTNGRCDHLTLDWSKLTYQHTSAIQSALLETYAPATAARKMCALRRVLKEAKRLGLMTGDDYIACIDLPSIKESRKLRGRALTNDEIKSLMTVCENDPTDQGLRDAALIAILRGAGLRRSEAVKLELKDFDPETRSLQVLGGKGNKDRLVYLPESAISILDRWLKVRGYVDGALLCPIWKSGKIQYRCMSSQAVLLIVQKRAEEAGVESFSPHDFRRTFCSDLLDAGVDIVTVQKLAGHASPVTTAKYDRRGEAVKRRAVDNLGF
ncbi:tyrosine-type recombinase/integrase [Crocosphaera sp. Alani8]|uniref:tyrosine-type recombinase/integrase n=1 Tax=Crocosphaera sp. Alani8 TaxID=3038952 RepID=UPI00313D41C0